MSDPRDHSDTPPADSDAFQAWVEHTAETRGVDKQELLNQLVSAFWILDEMNGVTADTDVPNADAHSYPPDAMGSKSTKPGSSEEPTSSRDPAVDASTEPTASDSVKPPQKRPLPTPRANLSPVSSERFGSQCMASLRWLKRLQSCVGRCLTSRWTSNSSVRAKRSSPTESLMISPAFTIESKRSIHSALKNPKSIRSDRPAGN